MSKTGRAARAFVACVLLTVVATPALAAVLEGTRDDDVLVGTNGRDEIDGRAGDDEISGRRGNDNLLMGGFGSDRISGGVGHDNLVGSGRKAGAGLFADNGDRGADILSGGDQDDSLMGGLGPDKLSGGAGGDLIYDDYNEEGGPREDASRDLISAGPGVDAVGTHNDPAARVVVSCGSGRDTVYFADETDLISDDCEEVDRG
jgi:Ca2+-binding RTX toxin-like protein